MKTLAENPNNWTIWRYPRRLQTTDNPNVNLVKILQQYWNLFYNGRQSTQFCGMWQQIWQYPQFCCVERH